MTVSFKTYQDDGRHYETYSKMFEELVPMSGKADTLKGEILRAASRVYYDLSNNGWCNDTAPSAAFLLDQIPAISQEAATAMLENCGEHAWSVYDNDNFADKMNLMVDMVDTVMEHILAMSDNPSNEVDSTCDYPTEGYGFAEYDEYEEEYDLDDEYDSEEDYDDYCRY